MGIELAPRDFVMDSAFPFYKQDIISLVPVHKVKVDKAIVKVFAWVIFSQDTESNCAGMA